MPSNKLCLLLVAASLTGCTSISSTLLNRTDSDLFVGNSNGEPNDKCKARPFKGIPITVRVPTHVDVAIREKVRFYAVDQTLKPLKTAHRHLFVETNLIYTDKVFTVDVKRPAAGTLNYVMEFGEESEDSDNRQYFKTITSKIEDKTLADVTTALSTVMQAIRTDSGEGEGKTDPITAGVIEEDRTVAWKRFDLDAYDFEQQVTAFVEQHLNCCHNCAPLGDAVPGSMPYGETYPLPAPAAAETPSALPLVVPRNYGF